MNMLLRIAGMSLLTVGIVTLARALGEDQTATIMSAAGALMIFLGSVVIGIVE